MFYLASQSPRRRELLGQLGATFTVLDIDIVERRANDELPVDYVRRVAREKSQAGFAQLSADKRTQAIVLGADTEVVLEGDVFGKPGDASEAAAMLRRLSGHTHQVISAIWLTSADREFDDVCISNVRFAPLDEATIDAYVASGEPFGKAGAYAIQGHGATLIEHLEGSYSGVMGLPLFETARLLRTFGIALSWRQM